MGMNVADGLLKPRSDRAIGIRGAVIE